MLIFRKFNILILSAILLLFSSCKKDSWCNCLENTGGEHSEIRQIADFHTIEMDNNVDVILTPGTTTQVKVTCGKNLVDGIKTEVSNGILHISNINKCNWLRDFKNKFTVEVTYKKLEYITNLGNGNLNCSDTLIADRFQVDSWNGTGVLNFIIDCREIYFKLHTGPGDIVASGKTGIMYVYTAGNGFVKVAAVESDNTYVTSKSTGDCEVSVSKTLEAIIEYHGDVYYKGVPTSIHTELTSSGKLIPF